MLQPVHVRSVVGVPGNVTYCPGVQTVHGVQETSFAAAENESSGQSEQSRSEVAVPCTIAYCPGLQSDHAVQAAAFAVAL